MAIGSLLLKTSLNISRISSAVFNTNRKLDQSGKTAAKIGKTLFDRNKRKRETIKQSRLLFFRRRESVRRKEQESIIEASGIGGAIKRQGKVIAESTKGFLGRIMDFVGTLLVGWLLNNLPTIIGLAQELIARIQKFVNIMGSFVNNTIRIFRTFGDTLGAIYTDVTRFELTFPNTRSQVEKSMNELDDAFSQLNNSFDEAFRIFTTPFTTEEGEGAYSQQPVPEAGSQWGDGQEAAPSGGGFSGSGVAKGAQIAKRLQKDLGLKDYQAAAVVGNLLNESSQINPAQIQNGGSGLLKVDGKTGYGWAQWTFPARQRELYQLAQSMGVDPSKQPLTDEINYAMLVRELPRYDSGGRFRSSRNIEEASNWLLEQYFRPADRGPREQKERINDGLKVLQKLKSGLASAQVSPQPRQGVSTTVVDQFKGRSGSPAGIITSQRGMRDGRMHHGIDIAPAGPGYFVALKLSGKVSLVAVDPTGYGNYVDIVSGNMRYRFAHLAKVFVKQGQSYEGQTIGEIGTTGSSTGIHLHFEVRPVGANLYRSGSIDPRPYLGLLSIGRQLTGAAGQPAQVSTPTPTPAQVSASTQRRSATPEALTTPRKGPVIIVAPPSPQMPQAPQMIPMQGSSLSLPQETPDSLSLNRYITQKLLLDLAYT